MRDRERIRRRAIDPEIGGERRAQTVRGADAEDLVVAGAVEHVDARRIRQPIDERGIEMRWKHRPREQFRYGLGEPPASLLALDREPACGEHSRIRQRTMTIDGGEAVTVDERIEVVRRMLGVEPSRKHDGARDLCVERDADALELGLDERIVEARVVRDEEPAGESSFEIARDISERRRGVRVLGERNAVSPLRRARISAAPGHDEGPPFGDAVGVDRDDPDFGDPIGRRVEAGRFDIDECESPKVGPSWCQWLREAHGALSNDRSIDGKPA
ncbi:MAG TPA: hypothetical protein VFJ68_02180 [Casimicrobiaceae bacterium]|nr:hypothetical protein [Casimicrobiaceae bacterium]